MKSGDTLGLTLHVYNTSPQPLAGTSGIEVLEIAPADIQQEADLFLPGPAFFNIPPNQTYTLSGQCTASAPQNDRTDRQECSHVWNRRIRRG